MMKYDMNREIIAIFDNEYYCSHFLNEPADFEAGFAHYLNEGYKNGYLPNALFNPLFYFRQAGISGSSVNPLLHYAEYGAQQDISPNPFFDINWYRGKYNPDKSRISPFSHFIVCAKQGIYNDPNRYFNSKWYLKRYRCLFSFECHPLMHYILYSNAMVLDPSPLFSSKYYRYKNPDVADNNMDALLHYMHYGKKNNFLIYPADGTYERSYIERLNQLIGKSNIIHFHLNDKFTQNTINFINDKFADYSNAHLVFRMHKKSYTAQDFPHGDNVLEIDYALLNPEMLRNKKLVFHSLFVEQNITMLHNFPDLLRHSYWMVWGGDFYNAPRDEANDFVRNNIYGIGSFCDNEQIKSVYGTNHKFFNTNMAFAPITCEQLLRKKTFRKKNSETVIQINNSADESTIEILQKLARFRNKAVRIKTVVSYGETNDLVQKIVLAGKKLFGDKFSALETMLPPEEYLDYMAENDILILNQNRQQGSANCCMALMLGQKVFIRSEVSTFAWLKEMGIEVFDSHSIGQADFESLASLPAEIAEKNSQLIEKLVYGTNVRIEELKPVFEDDCFAVS